MEAFLTSSTNAELINEIIKAAETCNWYMKLIVSHQSIFIVSRFVRWNWMIGWDFAFGIYLDGINAPVNPNII